MLMQKMEEELGIAFVIAGNYKDRPANSHPDLCLPNLSGAILVGATDIDGNMATDNAPYQDIGDWAPGVKLIVPEPGRLQDYPLYVDGTSMGMCSFVTIHL